MLAGLLAALEPTNLAMLMLGSVLGLIIGAAPGLGPVFGLALVLSMTFTMTPAAAIIFMSAFYAACVYGGSITAILINAPGTPGSVATCFDGFAFTKRGEAGRALGISTMSSFIGGVTGVLALLFLGPPLAIFSLRFGPSEFFMLALVGLCLVALATKGNTVKGLMMSGLGLMLSFVGRSVVTGEPRFNFGTIYMEDGIPFVSVVIGVFAFAQAMVLANDLGVISSARTGVTGVWQGCMDVLKRPVTLMRNSILGTVIGIMPGLGINAANFICYVLEKNFSKNPEEFGNGVVEGIMAPEAANNGSVTGALVPAFGFGIPGSASAALFLSAMMIHGLQPGHGFFVNSDSIFPTIIWGMFFAQIAFLIMGLAGAKYFARVTEVPNSLLAPIIMVLCFIGAISLRGMYVDAIVMLIAGIFGYYLQKNNYPLACLVLGMILGPLAEDSFCRTMLLSRYSLDVFVTRPISLILLLCIVISFAAGPVKNLIRRRKAAA